MAKQRLPGLRYQKHTIQELDEDELAIDVQHTDLIASLSRNQQPPDRIGSQDKDNNTINRIDCIITSLDSDACNASAKTNDLQSTSVIPLNKQSSGMDKDLLIASDSSSYCNGGIRMNILASSDDTLNSDKQEVLAPVTSCVTANSTNHSLITTSNGKPPALISTGTTTNKPPYNISSIPFISGCSSAPSAVRNRQKFAHNRSVSTEVPSRRARSAIEPGLLTRPGSHSGPLQRINSFDRGTQTVLRNSLVRLNVEHRHHPRYESAISDIGVEYMKATGVLGIKFKQLQKPESQSHEFVSTSSRLLNYDQDNQQDKTNTSRSTVVCNDLPQTVPMNSNQMKDSHAIKINSDQDDLDISQNPHHHIGYRLGRRKLLSERRRKIADLCCLFAMIGLTLMIIETECSIASVYDKLDVASYVLKSFITTTTLVLLVLIGIYHAVEVQLQVAELNTDLFVVDNCIEDWRIAMSWKRVLQIFFELLICSIHPIPMSYSYHYTIFNVKTSSYQTAEISFDIVLSLPMFMRLYLIIRVLLLHSRLFTDASSRSIGALNKITFNTRFVLKTLMTIYPGTVMGIFMLSLWIICAWTIRACESYYDPLLANFLNTLYLIAITFLSVGYGDFAPYTFCGRSIAVVSGLMGAGCTALVVAVIARKLELTRAEKHVHNFMLETSLSKKLKNAAANVLRETWLIYKYTKLVKRVNSSKVRTHQRKFLKAIQALRLIKLKQRKLTDQANSLTDFAKPKIASFTDDSTGIPGSVAQTASQIHEIVSDLKTHQASSEGRIDKIEQLLNQVQVQVEALPHSLAHAMLERQLSTASFVSANDSMQPSPVINPRRLYPGINTSAQSSFDSYG